MDYRYEQNTSEQKPAIDYKATAENAINILRAKINTETEYFNVMSKINELSKYGNVVAEHLMHMSMADQLLYLKPCLESQQAAKVLVEKYDLEDELEENL